MMGELSPNTEADWESFGRRWLTPLVAILVRTVHEPALAFDVCTETLAAARTEWPHPIGGDDALAELLALAARILDAARARESIPALERRRHHRAQPLRLTIDEQRATMKLADAHLDLSPATQAAAEALARDAPPPWAIRNIRLSGLVDADSLPNHESHAQRRDDA